LIYSERRAGGQPGPLRAFAVLSARGVGVSESPSLRYFLSYSGRGLPLNLVSEIEPVGLEHRNTYFRAEYDGRDRMTLCEKIVYGEVELRHCYRYHDDGGLAGATIEMDGDTTELAFDRDAG
jgi:hypothetical protein